MNEAFFHHIKRHLISGILIMVPFLVTSIEMLLLLRCTTFIGVCVEFVAAVAWLAELFPDPKRREAVLGFTQAFSSLGGKGGLFGYYIVYAIALVLIATRRRNGRPPTKALAPRLRC